MSMPPTTRLFALAIAMGALASTAVFWLGATPAAALPGAGCVLLQKCPPTPTVTTNPPATTTPPATVATTTTRPTSTTPTTAAAKAPTTTTTTRKTPGVASVGATGLPPAVAAPGDLSGLGTGVDPAAPQLAGIPAPAAGTTVVVTIPPALSGLVGTAKGLPNDHASLRMALSVLVLLVAGVAIAQLPASRRLPRPSSDTPD